MLAVFDALGEVDLLGVGQQRRLGDLAQVEPDRVIDEVGIETLEDIEVSLEIDFGFDLPGELGLDLFGISTSRRR